MSDSASVPPPLPSAPPPSEEAAPLKRVITLTLDQPEGRGAWRKRRGAAADRFIRLAGSEITFEHPSALRSALTVPAGLVAIASVDRGRSDGGGLEGRFAILRRMSATAVLPQSDGVEGWLWTSSSGSALPMLGDGTPNLALVFIKPLEEDLVEGVFQPEFLAALAQHSPLGVPTIFGLLARVTDPMAAEGPFELLGATGPLTDREVAPAQRRHLPSDVAANPTFELGEDRRRETSVPPPGLGRRRDDR